MKYFIDQEFIEGFHKPLFGRNRHFIDLISIGIAAEDGREYYAISKEFDVKEVWNKYDLDYGHGDQRNNPPRKVYWLRDNVLQPIFEEWKNHINAKIVRLSLSLPLNKDKFNYKNFKKVIGYIGKSNKQIATEIMLFIWEDTWSEWIGSSDEFFERGKRFGWNTDTPIEFYGYYADYDWVLFCSLFGRMIDLPKGFPMYMRDLKQMLDDYAMSPKGQLLSIIGEPFMAKYENDNETVPLELALKQIKKTFEYPKQTNEHNALADAKWNFELYKFLQKI